MAPTAGIDWAGEAHEVCISEEGQAVGRFSVSHDERGIADLTQRLRNECPPSPRSVSPAALRPARPGRRGLGGQVGAPPYACDSPCGRGGLARGRGRNAPLGVIGDESWDRMITVDLTGTFNCMRAEVGAMLGNGGSIVNTSSGIGLVGFAGQAHYVAAKHG